MLFTAPLFKLFHGRNKQPGLTIRGYVDDGLLTARAKKEELGAKMIESAFAKVEKWADENGMIFDPDKFEAIHFSRKKAFSNPDIRLPPLISPRHNIPERVVRPVGKKASMRWLGVFYDSRLSFKDHANKLASKGRQAASGLKMLVKTTRGVNAAIMRRAVHACILPILTYAAPAWWPGRTRTNREGRTVQNSMEGLCTKLDKVQNIALRAVLPVWKTIPISILQKEAGTPPVHHTLDYLCKLAAIRLHRLEPRHPLRIKTRHASASPNPSRLERIAQECPAEVEYSDPLLDTEPWEKHLFGGPKKCLDATGGIGDKEKATAQFKTWLKTLSPLDMVIYTDGSQETDQTGTPTGAALAGSSIGWIVGMAGAEHP